MAELRCVCFSCEAHRKFALVLERPDLDDVAEPGVGQASPDSATDELVTVEDWWLCAFHQDVPDFYCCQRTQMPECVPVRTYFQRGEYRRAAIDGAPNALEPSAASRAVWPEATT